MRAESAYAELLRRVREKAALAGCAELLAWDEATYLPQNAGEHRAAQLALLAGLTHDRGTDPRLSPPCVNLEGEPDGPQTRGIHRPGPPRRASGRKRQENDELRLQLK